MSQRLFRTTASYVAEGITRAMVPTFLLERRFTRVQDQRTAYGRNESQTVTALSPEGGEIKMRVRICWRRAAAAGTSKRSAAQLLPRVENGEWERTIARKVERERDLGISHFLFVQREGDAIVLAALVPLSELLPIWRGQCQASEDLIEAGRTGRRKSNLAKNGSSPTLWLQDDDLPEIAAVLWSNVEVEDLVRLERFPDFYSTLVSDDTYHDISDQWEVLGREAASRRQVLRSLVPRDAKVRAAVLERASELCERPNCAESRPYRGFLDVHHVLGAERSDRVWNCVALCPNCHRDAHFAPDRESLNAALLAMAEQTSRGFDVVGLLPSPTTRTNFGGSEK